MKRTLPLITLILTILSFSIMASDTISKCVSRTGSYDAAITCDAITETSDESIRNIGSYTEVASAVSKCVQKIGSYDAAIVCNGVKAFTKASSAVNKCVQKIGSYDVAISCQI